MLHICPRLPGQSFVEPPFEEEILAFLCFLGYSAAIKKLTDVNINKLYHPWRSFATIINKCLTEKSSGYDSLRLSQAQIMWGLYHKRNVDYAYLIWEDFVYQVEHKDSKKSNEMYYPRFTKVIIHHFMSKDLSIPRRNKVNWHYVRDDHMFSTIKLLSEHQNTQQFIALLPIELTNEDTRNSNVYKEYYAVATGAPPPKPKASVWKRNSSDTIITPPTATAGPRLTISEKGNKQLKLLNPRTYISQASGSGADEGTGSIPGVLDVPTDESEEELSWNSTDEEDFDEEEFIHPRLSTHAEEVPRDEESFDPIPKAPEDSDDEGNGEKNLGLNVGREERHDEEEEEDELYRDVNINQGRGIQMTQEFKDLHVTLTLVNPDGQQQSSSVSSQFVTSMLNSTLDVGMESIFKTTSQMDVQTLTSVASLPMNLYKDLVEAYESNKIILDTYRETITLKRRYDDDADKDEEPPVGPDRGSKRRREGKEPESASTPKEKATRSTGKSTQGTKSRQASASESAKAEEPRQTTFQMEEPSHLEFDRGAEEQPIIQSSQHPEWFSQQQKPPTLNRDWNKTLPATHESIQPWISKLAKQSDSRSSFNELMDTPLDFSNFLINRLKVDTLTSKLIVGPTYELLKGSCKSLVELEYHLKEVYKATKDQLDWVNLEGASSRKYTTSVSKTKAADYAHIKWIEDLVPNTMWIQEPIGYDKHALWGVSHWGRKRQQFYGFAVNWESSHDMYSKRRIIAVTELKILKWHNYKHLDWIMLKNAFPLMSLFECLQEASSSKGVYDRLKGIRIKYMPHSIWRKSDKDRAATMIQAIDKRLKIRRIMRILERFVGGRLYEGDFRMLQRTI
nr:hypothetical protein [Tanacetum cinerariifolium]